MKKVKIFFPMTTFIPIWLPLSIPGVEDLEIAGCLNTNELRDPQLNFTLN